MDQLDALVTVERLDHLLALARPHEPGVDVDARELRPIARCTSAAATAESTPPLRAQMHPLGTDLGPHGVDGVLDDRRIVHVGRAPHTSKRNRSSIILPPGVCATSGWNWTP